MRHFPAQVQQKKESIAGFEQDLETLRAHPLPEQGFVGMDVGEKIIQDKEAAGKLILAACPQTVHGEAVEVGCYRGFRLLVSYDTLANHFNMKLQGAIVHTAVAGDDARGNIQRLDNVLEGMEDRMKTVQEQLENLNQQVEAAKKEVGKPFPQEDELKTKSACLAELDALLNMDGGQNEKGKGKGKEDRQDEQPAQAPRPRPSVREMLKAPCRHGEPKQQKEREEQVL